MKFVNFSNAGCRRSGESPSEAPYGRKESHLPPALPSLPAPRSVHHDLRNLLGAMKPEPKGLLESKLLRASRIATPDEIKRETEDILAILRKVGGK